MGNIFCFLLFLLPISINSQANFPFYLANLGDDTFLKNQRIPKTFVETRDSAAAVHCLRSVPSMVPDAEIEKAIGEVYQYLDRTEYILGADPEPGQVASTGLLGTMIHAYNTRIIADERILRWTFLASEQEQYEEKARRRRREAKILAEARDVCEWTEWDNFTGSFVLTLEKSLKAHIEQEPYQCFERSTRVAARKSSVVDYIWNAYAYAMFMLSFTFDIANDFDVYPVDGRLPQIATSTFKRMYEDSEKSEKSIENNFRELQQRLNSAVRNDDQPQIAFYKKTLNYFKEKKKSEKYLYLFNSSATATALFKMPLSQARLVAYEDFKVSTEYCEFYYKNAKNEGYVNEDNAVNKVIEGEIDLWEETLWIPVTKFYKEQLEVSTMRSDSDAHPNPKVFYDGRFEFDLTKPLQNSRVAQDLLDKFDEEMKCYLKKSYWFDLVNGTLTAMQKRFETKQIFSHWSKTMYTLCEKTETDLIGDCTVENHEMCVPVLPSEEQQTYINENQDLSYHKPKWVFTRTKEKSPTDFTCEGKRTYIIPLNVCRCGVRIDCGSDIGEDIRCVLVENDDVRRQCKGSIGYPCQSLPLAPGRHDESCVTGYCDMKENMCAEDPRSYESVE